MAVAFSLASWNVEHFGRGSEDGQPADPDRLARVCETIERLDPDVFAIYEVDSRVVFNEFRSAFPDYTFHITEGPGAQEIMVGGRSGLGLFFSQRLEFTSGSLVGLRPGALLTVTTDGANYPLLFLHTKSISDPRGFGLRSYQIDKAFNLKKALDASEAASGVGHPANFVFLGDLNSMGMTLTYSDRDIAAGDEISRLRRYAAGRGMHLLSKSKPHTFWNGPDSSIPKSDLDHVVAANHLKFTSFGGAQVKVAGWPDKPSDQAAGRWIAEHSDHAVLFLKIHKP